MYRFRFARLWICRWDLGAFVVGAGIRRYMYGVASGNWGNAEAYLNRAPKQKWQVYRSGSDPSIPT